MTTTETKALPRLRQRYREEIRDSLQKEFGYANVMQIPGITKVVVNMGVGDAARDAKLINGAVNDLALITGQKPEIRRARKSIAQFKLREGMPIGARVTLRWRVDGRPTPPTCSYCLLPRDEAGEEGEELPSSGEEVLVTGGDGALLPRERLFLCRNLL